MKGATVGATAVTGTSRGAPEAAIAMNINVVERENAPEMIEGAADMIVAAHEIIEATIDARVVVVTRNEAAEIGTHIT